MTAAWDRITDTGSGEVNFRLQIEGFPFEPVTDKRMESTATDGRIRYAGLDSSRITLRERVDLVRAHWEPEGFRVVFVDRNERWTEAFKKPTAVTYLSADLAVAGGTATVLATGAFPATGKIWVDTEVMSYSGKTDTSFTGLTRGVYQTLDQKHFTLDGERARLPEVTDWPRVREGRRVALYVYASGDDLASTSPTAGTKIWTGVVSTEPTYDGTGWSFSVDPITRKWDQDIGGDLEDPAPIRGIYYPAVAPLVISAHELDSPGETSATGVIYLDFAIAGFWETQEEFTVALTAEMATQFAAFTQTVSAVVIGDSWAFEFQTGSAPNNFYMQVRADSAVDKFDWAFPTNADTGLVGNSVAADSRYRFTQSFGQFPRATLGSYRSQLINVSRLPAAQKVGLDPATNPMRRIYVGGSVGVTSNTGSVAVEWDSNGPFSPISEAFTSPISSVDTTNRFVVLRTLRTLRPATGVHPHYSALGSDVVALRFGRSYGTGHLGDFITNLTAETPTALNTGAVPDVRASDFASIASTDIPAAAAASLLASNRTYSIFAPVSFRELVEHECRLLGVFPAYDASGAVTFRRVRLPGAGEVEAVTITAADIITGDGEWLGYEIAPLGQFNTVEFQTGYDPVEDEYNGPLQRVRDLRSWAQNPDGRVLQVSPKSIDRREGFSYQDIVQQFGRILGTFGGPYAYLRIRVKFKRFSTLVGDVIKLTWNKVPNADGTIGVTNKVAFVVAQEWDFTDATGALTLMLTDQNIAGYAPATKISGIVGSSGTIGPFTANANTDYFPGSTQAADHWKAGDLVRLFAYDSTSTANDVTATLDSDPAGNSLLFTTDANWTHTGTTWVLGSQVSTSITAASQKIYNFIANADGTLDFSSDTGNPAQTLAP